MTCTIDNIGLMPFNRNIVYIIPISFPHQRTHGFCHWSGMNKSLQPSYKVAISLTNSLTETVMVHTWQRKVGRPKHKAQQWSWGCPLPAGIGRGRQPDSAVGTGRTVLSGYRIPGRRSWQGRVSEEEKQENNRKLRRQKCLTEWFMLNLYLLVKNKSQGTVLFEVFGCMPNFNRGVLSLKSWCQLSKKSFPAMCTVKHVSHGLLKRGFI